MARMFIAGEVTKVPWVNIKELCHEYDERGNHRITSNGAAGDWVSFGEIALFKTKDDRLFRAYTSYYPLMNEIEEAQSVVPRTLSQCYGKE